MRTGKVIHPVCTALMAVMLLLFPFQKSMAQQAFIKIKPSKAKVYVGEVFDVSYLLYSSVPALEPESDKPLEFANCFTKEYPPDKKTWTETIKGRKYQVMVLKKYAVIPFSEGVLQLPGLNIDLKMTMPPAADDFFQQEQTVIRQLSTEKATVDVMKAPPANSSLIFSGAVGKFKAVTTFKPEGDLLNVTFKIWGTGNLRSLSAITEKLPAGIEAFGTEQLKTDTLLTEGLHAEYRLSYKVLARYRGNYNIPARQILVFNAASGKYDTLVTAAYNWKVSKGPAMPDSLKQGNIDTRKAQPFLYFSKRKGNGANGKFFGSIAFYIVLTLIIVSLTTVLMLDKVYHDRAADPEKYRYKKAYKKALRRLNRLKKQQQVMQQDKVLKDLDNILANYLIARLRLSTAEISLNNMLDKINDDQVRQQLQQFLEHQQQARFAANGQSKHDINDYYQIIKRIEAAT